MCKRSIRPVIEAFLEGKSKKVSNTSTDGKNLWLFGNLIAYKRGGELWISSAGWESKTTKDRLNALPGVQISQVAYQWYLNGTVWGGNWIAIRSKFSNYVNQLQK